MNTKELKDRLVPIHMSLPRHVVEWVEDVARSERRKPTDVYRHMILDCYEARPQAKPNGAHKHDKAPARA